MIGTIGEALVDMIEQPDGRFKACLGGSVFNFSLALARQEIPVAYLSPLSRDRFGDRFRAKLVDSGVARGAWAYSQYPTSLAMVSLDANGSPSYMFYRDGVADRDASAAELRARLPESMELMHTGGLALVDDAEKMLEVMLAAKQQGATLSVDANLRPIAARDQKKYLEDVRRALRVAHLVKVSDEDLTILGLGDLDLPQLSDVLFRDSVTELIAVTLGARGAALVTRECIVQQDAPAGIEVVDTVGAGDCFHAGLIAYLTRSHRIQSAENLRRSDRTFLESALRHAIACATINVSRAGCEPPTWQEAREFQARVRPAPQSQWAASSPT